ncbi:MAG: hypothetical protein Q8N88_06420 [Nanoarchaeota archaeon]|nr:hypothetical protein [Nanoarchaeota archaeon]
MGGELTTIVELESKLASQLKRTFRSKPNETPDKYYHMLMAPYLDPNYKTRRQVKTKR